MSKIRITQKGSFRNLERYVRQSKKRNLRSILERYGPIGIEVLAAATPIDSSLTSNSWYYEIVEHPGYVSLRWHNRNVVDGVPVVILLEYGHGTRNGGFVQGHDFIMPAMRPIFDQITAEIGEEVTK